MISGITIVVGDSEFGVEYPVEGASSKSPRLAKSVFLLYSTTKNEPDKIAVAEEVTKNSTLLPLNLVNACKLFAGLTVEPEVITKARIALGSKSVKDEVATDNFLI